MTTVPPARSGLAAAAEAAPDERSGRSRTVLGVPAYFSPGAAWSALAAGAPAVRYVIVNPSSGPGLSGDPSYAEVVAASRAVGLHVLGYVSTRWGARPMHEVRLDIQRYQDHYGVSSIFLDEASSAARELPHYRELTRIVRGTAPALVALNPGVVPDEGYAELADLLVVFEGSCSAYRRWVPPQWRDRYPRERFWHLVHATPQGELGAVLSAAQRRSAGVVYVTDDVLDNPWDRLPSYWSQALEAVRALNR